MDGAEAAGAEGVMEGTGEIEGEAGAEEALGEGQEVEVVGDRSAWLLRLNKTYSTRLPEE